MNEWIDEWKRLGSGRQTYDCWNIFPQLTEKYEKKVQEENVTFLFTKKIYILPRIIFPCSPLSDLWSFKVCLCLQHHDWME